MKNANYIKHFTWSVTGAALLLGLLAGLLLSYRNSAPINRLLGIVREQFGKDEPIGRDAYDFLQGNIAEMLSSNKRLEEELSRQLPLIRDAFFKRLLAGEFQTKEEIHAAAVQADTGFLLRSGFIGILQIHGYPGADTVEILNELQVARLLLKAKLRERASGIEMTDLGSDRIVVIIPDEQDGEEEHSGWDRIRSMLEQVSFMFTEYKMTLSGSFGERFVSVMEVSRSYEQAKETMGYAEYAQRRDILCYADIRQISATYYYPLEMELRLIGTIRAGEREEAARIVDSIVIQNTDGRELSPEMTQQLAGELKGTMLKLLDQKVFGDSGRFDEVKREILDIQPADSISSVQEELQAVVGELCGMVESRRSVFIARRSRRSSGLSASVIPIRSLLCTGLRRG